jgi:hypothetical protein
MAWDRNTRSGTFYDVDIQVGDESIAATRMEIDLRNGRISFELPSSRPAATIGTVATHTSGSRHLQQA